MPLPFAAVLIAAATVFGGPSAHAMSARDSARICQKHTVAAETINRIPNRLLTAISLVESGRRSPEGGEKIAWPWTINAEGEGKFFATKAEAIAEVRRLQQRGVRSIDVGCMQVNLLHHPRAFASLDDAFDPQMNVAYAARFLLELKDETKSWTQAVGFYHSRTEANSGPYRAKVMAAWNGEVVRSADERRQLQLAEWQRQRDELLAKRRAETEAQLARQREDIELRRAALRQAAERTRQLASIEVTRGFR